MGRKNRIIISKYNDSVEENDSNDIDEDDDTLDIIREEERISDIIWKTRIRMIEYVDNMALPICDYLDQEVFENFIYFLSKQ